MFSVRLQFVSPSAGSVLRAVVTFALQMCLFAGGVAALSKLYDPPVTESADFISFAFYPYLALELAIFVLAGILAVSTVILFMRKREGMWRLAAPLLLIEGVLLAVMFALSSIAGGVCTGLISSSHFPAVARPTCGISSFNFETPWFLVFSVVTVLLWSWLLAASGKISFEFDLKARVKAV